MKQLVPEKLSLDHAVISRLSSNGESLRTVREIGKNEQELLDALQSKLSYSIVRHDPAGCTIGETIYIITLLTSDRQEMKVEVRHNAMYSAEPEKLKLRGVVNSSLVQLLDTELSKSETVVFNPALELLQALG